MDVDPGSKSGVFDVSVVIPTLNAARHLPATLSACQGAGEILVVDGGSQDDTVSIARRRGARVICSDPGRGIQLRQGAAAAQREWLLFLHADTVLGDGWRRAVSEFTSPRDNRLRAATFQFGLDDPSVRARRLERMVAWRVRLLGLAYGDQGLLIHRTLYRSLGGFRALPLMEDVDFVRRIGRHRLTVLNVIAHTSAERWHQDGWRRRSLRNLGCLALYFLGAPPHRIAKLYRR